MKTARIQNQLPLPPKTRTNATTILDASSQSEALQRKADMANNAVQREEAPRPNNTGMPDNLKSGIESLSGFSMDDVRVHYNSSKPATVQALAYTQGTDIHVAPGQEKHLPHEAWHVAQQMAGRVSPTTNINGMPVNDNAGLEHEADVMGEKAVQCKTAGLHFTNGKEQCSTVQRMAYAKTNEDGTVSAETDQYEGNERLAGLFGRKKGDKRPEIVAQKVDQYKKEMLTYIAHCIAEKGKERNANYGLHISVVITGGVWYIALNSDCNVNKDDLNRDAQAVKEDIKKKWRTIESKLTRQDFEGNVKEDIELAKKQALYITYRWAGKEEKEVVVSPNEPLQNDGVRHGEMATIDYINNQAAIKLNSEIYALACEISCCRDDLSRMGEYGYLWNSFMEKIKQVCKEKTEEEYYKLGNNIINNLGRVIRVGGTKTPCFDCAYEMHVHNDYAPEIDKETHKSHDAVNNRNPVTMTPNFGKAFVNWSHHGIPRPSVDQNEHQRDNRVNGKNERATKVLSFDEHQDQDYNELYDTFNSTITDPNKKMQITESMLDVWDRRKTSLEKNKSDGKKDLPCFASLNFENSLQLKSLIENHLEKIYKLNDANSIIPKLPSGQGSLVICLTKINNEIDSANDKPVDEKSSSINKLIQYERLVIEQLNMNVQKNNGKNEYIRLNGTDDRKENIDSYKKYSGAMEKLNTFYELCQKIVEPNCFRGSHRTKYRDFRTNDLDNIVSTLSFEYLKSLKAININDLSEAHVNCIGAFISGKKAYYNKIRLALWGTD